MWKTTAEGQPFSTHHKGWNRGHKVYVNKKSCTVCNGRRRFTSLRPFDRIKKDRIAGPRHKHKPCAGLRKQRPSLSPGKQKPGAGTHPEQAACVQGWAKEPTGRTALRAADAPQAATRVTHLPLWLTLRRDGACANCLAQPRELPTAGARLGQGTNGAHRFAGSRRTTGCIAGDAPADTNSPAPGRRVRELPTAGAGERRC